MIYRWFGKLFQTWANSASERSTFSELLFRLYASANATYEGILDRGQGGAPQKVKGHDHVSIARGGTGGAPISRSTAYVAGKGQASLFDAEITPSTGGANVYTITVTDIIPGTYANSVNLILTDLGTGLPVPGYPQTAPPTGWVSSVTLPNGLYSMQAEFLAPSFDLFKWEVSGPGVSPALTWDFVFDPGLSIPIIFTVAGGGTGPVWVTADNKCSSSIARTANGIPMFMVYFSKGFDPVGGVAKAQGFIDAAVNVPGGGPVTYDARFHNLTTGTYSAASNANAVATASDPYALLQFEMTEIPFVPGWNQINLEYSTTSLLPLPDISTNFVNIGEWTSAVEYNPLSSGRLL